MRLVDVGVNSGQAYEFMSNFNCHSRTNILHLLRCGLFFTGMWPWLDVDEGTRHFLVPAELCHQYGLCHVQTLWTAMSAMQKRKIRTRHVVSGRGY